MSDNAETKPQSARDWAKEYMARGWAPIPLRHNSKNPGFDGWDTFVANENTLFNANVGLRLGDPSHGLTDVDLDFPEARILAPYILPRTETMFGRPGSRNAHWLYYSALASAPFKDPKVREDDDKKMVVEIRSTNLQTMVPPSIHPNGEQLEWSQFGEPARPDPRILKACVNLVAAAALLMHYFPGPGARFHAYGAVMGFLLRSGVDVETVEDIVRSIAEKVGTKQRRTRVSSVAKMHTKLEAGGEHVPGLPKIKEIFGPEIAAAVANWLSSYSETARIARFIRELGLSPDDAKVIADLAALPDMPYAKVRKEKAKALDIKVGILDALVQGYRRAASPPEESADDFLSQMNDRFFVSREGGTTRVYENIIDPEMKRHYLLRSTFKDIEDLFSNITVGTNVRGDPITLGKWWLDHPQRRTYPGGIVFRPGRAAERGEFNLWQGWTIEPKPGNWSLLRDHLRDDWCRGNVVHFDYLRNLMASTVQYPERQGEIAVVVRGPPGIGKGLPIRLFGSLFGQHFMQILDAEHVVGRFNLHLRDCVVLFADEAFYAGNRKHADILKGLITEPMLNIEPKNVNLFTVPNRLHIWLSSNHAWVVPVGHDDRRYFVLDPAANHTRDRAYFGAMLKEMDEGGSSAMLHELLTIDLSGFDLGNLPETEARIAQKRKTIELSQDPDQLLEAWWLRVLEEGELPDECDWNGEICLGPTDREPTILRWRATRDLQHAASQFHERLRDITQTRVGAFMDTKLVGGWKHRPDGKGSRGYCFDSLDVHRQRWIEQRGYAGQWLDGNWDA
jgi:hypothetical protein